MTVEDAAKLVISAGLVYPNGTAQPPELVAQDGEPVVKDARM